MLLVTKPTKQHRRIHDIQDMLHTLTQVEGYGPKMVLIADHTIVNDNVLLTPWSTAEGTVVIADAGKENYDRRPAD